MPPEPDVNTPLPMEDTVCALCGEKSSEVVARGQDTIYWSSRETFTYVACSACGHLYLNPRPSMAAIDRIYPSSYATFSGRFSRGDALIAKIKDRILQGRFKAMQLDLPEDAVILDVGCGDGSFLVSLRGAYPGARLIGCDWHFPDATRKVLEAHGVEMVEGPIENVDLPDGEVDLINMNQLIEHVWDPRAVIQRCVSTLKSGGCLALETPNPEGYDRKFWFGEGKWGNYYWPRHLNLFSPDAIESLTRESGMQTVQRMNLLAPPCWVYTIIAYNRSRPKPIGFIESFFKDTNPIPLALFAVVDGLARLFGFTTSNQKLITRKP